MRFTGAAIAAATGGVLHGGEHTGAVGTDTRALPAGAWFVALVGPNFDAHRVLADQGAPAAGGAVVSRPVPGWDRPWVAVDDTLDALQRLGGAARDRLTGPVVGITGSNGKTTTRALVALALGQLGEVHATDANLNNHIGVPLTLLGAPEDAPAAVVEMGISAPGEMALLAGIARPDVRVITNVGPAHLEALGGLDGVQREKRVLFETARPGDVCIVNADDPRLADEGRPGCVRWGRAADAHVRLREVTVDVAGWSAASTWDTPWGAVTVRLPSPAPHVTHDAGAALAVGAALDLDLARAAADLGAYAPVGMRLRPQALPGGVVAINDAYNANPGSTRAALGLLATLPRRRVAVLGDHLELGPDEAAHHAAVVAHADQLGLDLLVLCGPRMAAARGAATATEVWHAEDGVTLAPRLAAWLEAGDHVLFKGSRGARVEAVLDAVAQHREAVP